MEPDEVPSIKHAFQRSEQATQQEKWLFGGNMKAEKLHLGANRTRSPVAATVFGGA